MRPLYSRYGAAQRVTHVPNIIIIILYNSRTAEQSCGARSYKEGGREIEEYSCIHTQIWDRERRERIWRERRERVSVCVRVRTCT